MNEPLYVIKRNGERVPAHFDKITARIKHMCGGIQCDPTLVAQKVIGGMYPGVTTSELDVLSAETAAYMVTIHPDYALLAGRILVSNLHKQTDKSFLATARKLHQCKRNNQPTPLFADDVMKVIEEHAKRIQSVIVYDRDLDYEYFAFKTLEKSYLLRVDDKIVERPQHMLMRVAFGVHKTDVDSALKMYEEMSTRKYTPATPTLFNAGMVRNQMSSCFLLQIQEDSIDGIYKTLSDCAKISQAAGGIGLAIHEIRAARSYIAGTNGYSNGIVPMLRVFDATARYVDQGGGKRNGSIAIYVEPWYADIFDYLKLKLNSGTEHERARDLFYALWIPDLFMKRVKENGDWTLFCPKTAPGLNKVYGEDFVKLYEEYERKGLGRETIKAQTLWIEMLRTQIERGVPYMLYKDACNEKSNQKNIGVIQSSNLCTEIVQYTSAEETAVCNLASMNLKAYIKKTEKGLEYDLLGLSEMAGSVLRNLNKVIDYNYYPVPEAKVSNMRHRPVGLGVQGLADVFCILGYPFASPEARKLNVNIWEAIYYGAMKASCELAKVEGPYETFVGSPFSKGIFQFDFWDKVEFSGLFDWESLKADVIKYGVRNSLLTTQMPTASTAQILGNTEACEPLTSNLYSRRVLAGDFMLINTYLVRDLIKLGLWNTEMKDKIIQSRGSVQYIEEIPDKIKEIYKTVWEIPQRDIIDMTRDRAPFIDQSQSLNLHVIEPSVDRLTKMHFHAWESGLKTGMYYLRTLPKADAIQFTLACSIKNKDECIACSS